MILPSVLTELIILRDLNTSNQINLRAKTRKKGQLDWRLSASEGGCYLGQ
jgi:hypothetical protein